jgi:hypothetical protein
MRIRMLRPRVYQDAGRELPLDMGGDYDLVDAVAQSLVATGAAVAIDAAAVQHAPESKPVRPPETKPGRPPETKRGG